MDWVKNFPWAQDVGQTTASATNVLSPICLTHFPITGSKYPTQVYFGSQFIKVQSVFDNIKYKNSLVEGPGQRKAAHIIAIRSKERKMSQGGRRRHNFPGHASVACLFQPDPISLITFRKPYLRVHEAFEVHCGTKS